IHTHTDLSSLFKNISVQSGKQPFSFGSSPERIWPCAMSIACWKNRDLSSPMRTVDGHPLG
ncbi:unnamed protein product, partial [Rotaria magnacalcarata]